MLSERLAAWGITAPKVAYRSGVAFLVLLGALHFLESEFDPRWRLISEYEVGPYGWLMRLAFFLWGTGFLSLAVALGQSRSMATNPRVRAWLATLALAVFGAGIFVTQPITDVVRGRVDQLHAVCGALMIFTFPAAASFVARGLPQDLALTTQHHRIGWATVLVWLGFITFFASMIIHLEQIRTRAFDASVAIGIPNRIMVVTYTVWLLVVAQAADRTPGRG